MSSIKKAPLGKLFVVLMLLLVCANATITKASKISFWNKQHRGANYHNTAPTKEWWLAAKEAGITVVRLFPNNWPRQERDFLVGNADHYERLNEQDFEKLKEVLDQAQAAGIKVGLVQQLLPKQKRTEAR